MSALPAKRDQSKCPAHNTRLSMDINAERLSGEQVPAFYSDGVKGVGQEGEPKV
jgi:hypothetical protein